MESPSVGDMQFLFQKIDSSVFEPSVSDSASLVEICLLKTLKESDSHNTNANLLVSATLKRILTLYRDFSQPISIETSQLIVEYVFKKWDSSVDVICYEAVDSFGLLLDIHQTSCPDCKQKNHCNFRENVVQNLSRSPSTCKSIFKCTNLLANCYPWLDLLNDGFVEKLYQNIGFPSLAVISDTICSTLSSPKCNKLLHLSRIERSLLSKSKTLRSAVMDRLIPNLVKKGHSGLISQLLGRLEDSEWQNSTSQLETVLSIVGMLIKANGAKTWSNFVEKEVLSKALLHCSSQVRLTAWTLLCCHPRISTPYTPTDLDLMRVYLPTSAAEQSPAIRQKMLAAFKHVLIRMAETGEQAEKRGETKMLKEYTHFLGEILKQAFGSLCAEANFNRRILSLSLIDFVYRQDYLRPNGKSAFYSYFSANNPLTKNEFDHLLSCLDDSFQLCQNMSLDLLKSFPHFSFEDSDSFFVETKEIMTSFRSHNSLTASYRLQFYIHRNPGKLLSILENFLEDCEQQLQRAEKIMMSITETPVHSILSALVSLLPRESTITSANKNFWINFVQKKLIPFCYRMAALVTPVVHSMAPEGYIPEEELHELARDDNVSSTLQANRSQLLLVCCWRSHKHISEIFDWTVQTCYPDLISVSDVQKIGEYFWLQLTECRHCGAFESAVDGFTYLCSFLWKWTEVGLPSPIDWLKRILKALEGGEDLDNLCSTRRSAGVPHLVVAILSTEPDSSKEGLKLATTSLLNLERRELKYRIHSLNVLKAIVHSSTLRERITFIVEPACRLAVAGCSAKSWSERNSSAQLAAALQTHIFGVSRSSQRDLHVDSKNRQSAHEFFSRFPSLYSFLYHKLETVEEEFSAYPTLIFLTHLYATNTVTKYRLGPFIPLCLKTLLWCKAEKLRRLCAVAAVAICQKEDLEVILNWLSEADPAHMTQNHINSALLLLQAIFISKPELKYRIEGIVERLESNGCEFNLNLAQELGNQLAGKEGYYSNFAGVAEVQKEILGQRSFTPLTASNQFVRQELYEWLCKEDKLEIDEGLSELIAAASSDYKKELGRQGALLPKKVLDKYCGHITDVSLMNNLKEELRENGLLPESIAVSYSLLFKSTAIDYESLVSWARSTIDLEDDYPKLKALQICTESYEKTANKGFLKVLLEMLQDEDGDIREVVSEAVSAKILHKDFPLNPEVCRHFLIETIGRDEELFTREGAVNEDSLFDTCAANIYAEPRIFSDWSIVEKLL